MDASERARELMQIAFHAGSQHNYYDALMNAEVVKYEVACQQLLDAIRAAESDAAARKQAAIVTRLVKMAGEYEGRADAGEADLYGIANGLNLAVVVVSNFSDSPPPERGDDGR